MWEENYLSGSERHDFYFINNDDFSIEDAIERNGMKILNTTENTQTFVIENITYTLSATKIFQELYFEEVEFSLETSNGKCIFNYKKYDMMLEDNPNSHVCSAEYAPYYKIEEETLIDGSTIEIVKNVRIDNTNEFYDCVDSMTNRKN